MRSLAIWVAVLLAVTLVGLVLAWVKRYFKELAKHCNGAAFAPVAPYQATLDPYPYVYVDREGCARELHASERKYLETYFVPGDGNYPFIKYRYRQKDGWGEISGYIKRSKLPRRLEVGPAPVDDPNEPFTREEQIRFLRDKGLIVQEEPSGTFVVRKPSGPLGLV